MNLETIIGIALATLSATILRWAANRWPDASERRSRQRAERIADLQDRLEIKKLETELGEDKP